MTAQTDKRRWENMKAGARQQWHKLTDHDLRTIDGDQDKLVDRLHELYGEARDVLSDNVAAFFVRANATAEEGAQRVADSKQKNLERARDDAADNTPAPASKSAPTAAKPRSKARPT